MPGKIQTSIINDMIAEMKPGAMVMDVRMGPTWTMVRSTMGTGLASTLGWRMGQRPHVRDAGKLIGRPLQEIASLALSDRPMEAAIGMAAVNSSTDISALSVVELNAADLLAEISKGKKTAIIGSFPFARNIEQVADELLVFDLRPDMGHGPKDYPLLRDMDCVAVTGTVFLTHTLDILLAHIPDHAYTLMVGPTTPMHERLFDIGFNALCGVEVTSAEQAVLGVCQGATLKQVNGLRYVTAVKEVQHDDQIR